MINIKNLYLFLVSIFIQSTYGYSRFPESIGMVLGIKGKAISGIKIDE